ncbi:MAG: aminopeptidase family protein P [Proteobacteria bacterium]|nr:aminopeptidase family protein P [Pseudomonadota bacterium]
MFPKQGDQILVESIPSYRGDEELARLLAEAGAALSLEETKTLVAGAAAAPPGSDGWTHLVAPDLTGALDEQLRALRAASIPDDGLEDRAALPARLAALRAELERRALAGFLLLVGDEHHGEYVARRAMRLAWLTGFTGSAGLAVVLREKAALFVDGRYTLQAEQQVDAALFEHRHITNEPPADWIAAHLKDGEALGYDPWLHTLKEVERYAGAAAKAGATLAALEDNPIDAIWSDQPPAPIAPVLAHDLHYAGKSSEAKRTELAQALRADGIDAAVLTAPDSIEWLLNLRGGDVPCSPLALCFALLHANGTVELFIDARKLAPGLREELAPDVTPRAPASLGDRLGALAGRKVLADPELAPAWIFHRLEAASGRIEKRRDPCLLPKATKNPVEIAGARAAHRRDGAALVRFLCWLEKTVPDGQVSEMDAARYLAERRAENNLYRGPSFETISGAGANGAIVHYRVSPESDRTISPDELYLVDSGGQYLDGTTDVTRTLAFRKPGGEERDRFTRVLKGHIALARAHFPEGTTGPQLDTLARRALWEAGLDYDHGTGHGVGSYLGVHEGPQRISKLANDVALVPGMIVSNEPGYYKTGAYGIRIENLVVVTEPSSPPGAERPVLGFETLTQAPIDRKLIDRTLLDAEEIAWLDGYHASVRESLTPLLEAETAEWLGSATRPLDAP